MARKPRNTTGSPVGGLAFYAALLFLIPFSIFSISTLVFLLSQSIALERWPKFLMGLFIGFSLAFLLLRGKISVFLHELKHSIAANLVGNKAKGMKIMADHGHFEYEYNKFTGRFNAFISLAPYFFPLFIIPAAIYSAIPRTGANDLALVLVGMGYGIDLTLCLRDISPHQTDFRFLRGGFRVGLLFVVSFNLIMCSLIGAWVNSGPQGIKALGMRPIELISNLAR